MSGEPLNEFQEGQWWVKELDALVAPASATDDQKRAVAVVHNMLAAAAAAAAAMPAQVSAPEIKQIGWMWKEWGWTVTAHGKYREIRRRMDFSSPPESTKASHDFVSLEPIYIAATSRSQPEAIKSAQDWIPTSDQLPPLDQDVLMVRDGVRAVGCRYSRYDGSHGYTFRSSSIAGDHFKPEYWQPLPDLPSA